SIEQKLTDFLARPELMDSIEITTCARPQPEAFGAKRDRIRSQWSSIPPSTLIAWPVTFSAVAGKTARSPMASGGWARPRGMNPCTYRSQDASLDSPGCFKASARYSHICVRRMPGQIALTRTPVAATSLASELVKPTTANFEAQ